MKLDFYATYRPMNGYVDRSHLIAIRKGSTAVSVPELMMEYNELTKNRCLYWSISNIKQRQRLYYLFYYYLLLLLSF